MKALKQELSEDIEWNNLMKFEDQYTQLIKISSWEFAPDLAEKKEKEAKQKTQVPRQH